MMYKSHKIKVVNFKNKEKSSKNKTFLTFVYQ